ncbi:P-loop containing nucleoside triphosphate hydrolase protein [Boletus edulis BED1]|uniref:P-loop containing nucleoside triphosphate hydrolase protein n=1 Tax=Boletus edulis BED1 TaxID=1328754 RepID=A0AAD4CAQ4_BOLED|nr:P-loop containing nucleoside triphosphate hydrolase protein [Boletus edulis BED1]
MNNHEPPLRSSPALSLRTLTSSDTDIKQHDAPSSPTASIHDIPLPPPPPPAPTFKLLFSFLTPRRKLVLLTPAVASSVAAGGIAPFMTYVVGQSFNAFAAFPLIPHPSQAAKDALLHGVGRAALELVALGIGALLMSSVTSSLWIWTGEWNVVELRRKVYHAVVHNQMEWFDRQTGSSNPTNVQDMGGEGAPIGAGGLMVKFARETDDVRAASSLAAGQFIQYLTTTLTALLLAFIWSPLLTLVILSAVPFLILIQGFSQGFATPRLAQERTLIAHAASLVSRVVSNIGAVKAANAAPYEYTLFARVPAGVQSLGAIWGITAGTSQFVTMAMFVQGFWFGAHLVLQGKNRPGDVMSVFWACLIATSNLQMMVPLLVVLAKGKVAAAELAAVIASSQQVPAAIIPKYRKAQPLRRITPNSFIGDFTLTNLTFSYPTRPTMPVLRNVDIFLPSRETTFIVGPSGCGKSTIGSILLGYYTPGLGKGEVLLDEQDLRYLDIAWVRKHVAGVTQGSAGVGAQVFRGSIHWNVALGAAGSGRNVEDVTRVEVEEACRLAMLEGWVLGLEAGYETILVGSGESTDAEGGIVLSGGMRQRLALARARIRDPEVLILDESTSALDPVTRHLTTAAIRAWRSRVNKTTIVITHDLTSINGDDFVYVMCEGCVAEQGFRSDLEKADGEWTKMLRQGGCPNSDESDVPPPAYEEVAEVLAFQDEEARETQQAKDKHYSLAPTLSGVRPVTTAIGDWMFDVVAELTRTANGNVQEQVPVLPTTSPVLLNRATEFEGGASGRPRRPSSLSILPPLPTVPPRAYGSRRMSMQFSSTAPSFTSPFTPVTPPQPMVENDDEFESEKNNLTRSAAQAVGKRERRARRTPNAVRITPASQASQPKSTLESLPAPGLIATLRRVYPTIPAKHFLFLGLFACLLSGAMTPIFSFLLSRLMFEVSANPGAASINSYGAFVFGIAAIDGLVIGLKYFLMESSAIRWVTRLRNTAYSCVLSQDKAWFDSPAHSPAALAQALIEDADDARALVAVVMGQFVVVIAMMGVGLVWAMVWGWQLTLVGIAIGPVFVGVMAVQAGLVAKCEVRNKRAREDVARVYYETILNIRSMRAMSLESVLQAQFDKATSACLSTGSRGAFFEGCSYGVASALIYLAEALLFYVGAVLVANGTYTYLRMVQVLNLVVFTVTLGSQLMAFTQRIAKSVQATTDLFQFVTLPTDGTSESQGILRPPIAGDLVLQNVSFAYPTKPDTTVLKNFSMKIAEGECVALVGASGCGKSTVAALLQRLYEPASGTLSVGGHELRLTDVHHLRNHVAVVNQTPNLFDGTIRENIAYGHLGELTDDDIVRAARAAHAHDFVISLPQGYDTLVGENAALISGGQAQRLQIARALARPSRILILDECTSALDGANQTAVLETIRDAKVDRTTVMVTHKIEVMRMCDRVVVIQDGKVVEEGPYEMLVERRGVFAKLASGGEWFGD